MPVVKRVFAGLAAAVGWFALVLQFILIQAIDSQVAWFVRTINFFSYFTILSNLLVTLALTVTALAPQSAAGRAAAQPQVMTAGAVYMSVTGLIYFVLLRPLWSPQGWQFIADSGLHYAMPVLTVLYWLLFVRKGSLRFRNILFWLIFPLAYGGFWLLRGPFVGFYPYPFIDVETLGYTGVLRNMAFLLAGFAAIGAFYVLIDRLIGRFR